MKYIECTVRNCKIVTSPGKIQKELGLVYALKGTLFLPFFLSDIFYLLVIYL